jgi:serpin B
VEPVGHAGVGVELAVQVSSPPPVSDPSDLAAVASAEQGFAVRLLDQVITPGANVTVSPFSLAVALAMLENGAAGQTLAQIQAALGTSTLTPAQQDKGWSSLTHVLSAEGRADGISLDSADSLWLQRDLPMQADFMTSLADYFQTGVWQVDFKNNLSGAEQAINDWVSDHTAGHITQLFGPGELTPDTGLVLANAVYFDAAWQTPFDPAESAPGPFYPPTSQPVQVTFMNGPAAHLATTAGYQAADLPYAGGQYQALVVMPENQTLATFVAGLSATRLGQIAASADQAGEVLLPRLTTDSYLPLNRVLADMGMPVAFTDSADFSAMSTLPTKVQSAVQRDYLSVGEKGTEAAAATGISVMPTVAVARPIGPTVTFNRPYLFVVRDATTGTVLFASLVQNPGKS